MQITQYLAHQAVRDWAERIRELVSQDSNAASTIAQALNEDREGRFLLAILGKAKRGKSTLLNAFLNRQDDLVAPIDKLPATSVISRFRWAEQEQATIHFLNGRTECIPFPQIREYVTEEANPENVKKVEAVEVLGPFAGLERDLVLVDTPGASSIHEYHDTLVHGFIPLADAVIFLVSARMPLDADELDLLKRVKADDVRKIFFVINRVDESSEGDIATAVAHNRTLLSQAGIAVEKMHRLSAKKAFQGDVPGSGLAGLADEVRAYLAAQKGRVLHDRLVSRVRYAAQPVLEALVGELSIASKTGEQLDAQLRQLQEEKSELEPERSHLEREFEFAWGRALDEFERGLPLAQTEVLREINGRIDAVSVGGIGRLTRDLPTLIVREIEQRLRPAIERMEQALRGAASRLESSYPRLELPQDPGGSVRVRRGTELLSGVAKGALWTAGGLVVTQTAATVVNALVALPFVGGTFAPLAAVLGGPITMIPLAIGLLVAARGWHLSQVRQQDQLYAPTRERIGQFFDTLRLEHIPAVRELGKGLVREYQLRVDRGLLDLERAIRKAQQRRPSVEETQRLQGRLEALRRALGEQPGVS
jgi:GTPase SAR1 family protein